MSQADRGKELQAALADALLEIIKNGEGNAGIFEVARKFCKDNGISVFETGADIELERLGHNLRALPFSEPGENPKAI